MPEFRVRYLVAKTDINEGHSTYGLTKRITLVEKITATTSEQAKSKAEDLAEIRSKKSETWSVRAIEQI